MHSTTDFRVTVRACGDFQYGMGRVHEVVTALPFEPGDRLFLETDLAPEDVVALVDSLAVPISVFVESIGPSGERGRPSVPILAAQGADGLIARIQHMRFMPGDLVVLTIDRPIAEVDAQLRMLSTGLFPPFVTVQVVEKGRIGIELRRLDAALPDHFDPMH